MCVKLFIFVNIRFFENLTDFILRYGSDVLYVVDINGDILLIWIWGGIQVCEIYFVLFY